ncbi:MAG: S41 family peptidase [Bacteroidales bacterium]|nr:S41 family peptidase [Bacteroidales bacterium]
MSISMLLAAQTEEDNDPFFAGQRALMKQYPVPELTQEQMCEDFDTLMSIMKNCNPQCLVRKEVTGYDVLEQIASLRSKIATCTNTLDFIKLLRDALFLAQDKHIFIGHNVYWFKSSIYKEVVKRLNISGREYGYNFHYADSVFYIYLPALSLFYTDGRYFLKYDVSFIYENDTVFIPAGSELITFNGENIVDYQNAIRLNSSQWDFERKRFYHNKLEIQSGKHQLAVKHYETFLIQEVLFNQFTETIAKGDRGEEIRRRIHYFPKDSVLYIKLPIMAYWKKMIKQFQKELWSYKKYPYQSVIIDIRGNEGGSDLAWLELLSCIVDTSLKYTWHCVTNNTEQAKQILKLTHKKRNLFQVENRGDYITYGKEIDKIKPLHNNLKYSGTIYILVNEDIFSSGGALSSFSTKVDRIKTVGVPTGTIGGQGINPSLFILPNSRLMFSMEILLDASGVNTFEDFYHDKVSYPVVPSVDYYRYWWNPQRGYEINEKAMYEHDEIFLKVLEIIKQEQNQK